MSHPWDDVSDNKDWGIDPSPKKQSKKWIPFAILGFIVFALLMNSFRLIFSDPQHSAVGSSSSSYVPDTSPAVTSEPTWVSDTDWVPSSYVAWDQDSNVAYKLTEKQKCTSDYGCLQFSFISKMGCPNGFYAALNWLDGPRPTGAVTSYDNSVLPSLPPMQEAKLSFEDIEGNAIDAQMAEIKCY